VLGATETGPRVRLHLPREKPLADRRRLLADAEASAAEVLEVFGAATSSPALIDVYLFRSASEKRQLLGASDTSFTKPWLRQIHTNDAPAPHPILRHELVHALAADWSSGPFGVPGRLGGLLPDMAFIEGFAVAGDWPAGESTVDEEAAALRRLGRAPDLVALFAPGRFYAEAGPNAYTLAGSFVRFLVARSGGGAVRAAYGSPRGIEALGPLPALAREHAAYLDRLAVPETVRALAALRFSQPALARRTCPHEVAALREEAGRAGARGDRRLAGELWARCVALEPDDPGLLLQERRALLAANDPDGAGRIAARALAHPKLSQPQRAQLLVEEGDAALRRGQLDAAAAHYGEAALLPQAEAATRAVEARRSALAQPGWQMVAVRLFGAGDTGPDTLRLLAELDDAQPGEGFAAYLLAKQAQNRGDWAECLRTVRRARGRKLPGPLFLAEALRVQAACAAGRGDSAAGREALEALAKDPLESHRLEAVRALRRLGTGPG
jgi:tetratricopeptide (TPR) repeat protein